MDFESGMASFESPKKQFEVKENWYIKFARKSGTMFKAQDTFINNEVKKAIEFMGWRVTPKEVNTAPTLAMVVGFCIMLPVLAYISWMYINGGLSLMTLGYLGVISVLVPIAFSYYVQNYPIMQVNRAKVEAMTYIPEIINYLVMSMKLSPNLENAISFAAEHGRGKIAEDFKKLSWDTQMGKYKSIEEALDEIAYKWGNYSDEFKHALMIIRSSVIEIDETKRNLLLDKAVTDVLESISENMSKYANEMKQPSIYLYYVGVLLPLLLIIMLPIGSAMAGIALAKTTYLVLLYNILIPLGTVLFANNILAKRPPVYIPPEIPDSHPDLPKKGYIKIGKTEIPALIVAIIAGIAIFLVCAYGLEPLLNPIPQSWEESAIAAYFPFFKMSGIMLGITVAFAIYLYSLAYAKRKVQLDIMKMENEFQDSIYVLASRLGENRPIEEAIAYSAEFLKGSRIAILFQKTTENTRNFGMTVEQAFFDPIYGSLKHIPSSLISGSLKIVVDSIKLGVQQAARALISLSLQLRDSKKIQEKIKAMLEEITSMMKSIAFFIAPLVLGITSALQKIIMNALEGACAQTAESSMSGSFSLCANPEVLAAIPGPSTFLVIMALYVLEVTVILVYFTSKIEEGNNKLAAMINIAKSVPIALILFIAATWFAGMLQI